MTPIRDHMTSLVLTVGPDHTLGEAAKLMAERNVGAALVLDLDGNGPGIVTERDLLRCVGAGKDPATERVADYVTANVIVANGDLTLEEAADMMVRGGFRHLIVCGDHNGVAGVLSMRDIVRAWVAQPVAAV